MHRVGCASEQAAALAEAVTGRAELVLEGILTHLAVADEPANPYTRTQLDRFASVRAELARADIEPPVVHAANSAGLLGWPEARFDLARCGIALYGIAPAPGQSGGVTLRPALSLHGRVSYVKELGAGERISYGLRYEMSAPGRVATVPIGYADGVPRALAHVGGTVLVGGRRRAIAGNVTMDQIMVDVGLDDVATGDEVVLIGRQGGDEITAEEWATRVGTIAYEIVCGIGPRVPRHYRGGATS
jgi:alanine racemase